MLDANRLAEIFRQDGEDLIRSLYRALLHREADPEGLAGYREALGKGLSPERLLIGLRVSPEGMRAKEAVSGFQAGRIPAADLLNLEGESFVTGIWLAALGRTPDARELAANTATLLRGTDREVVLACVARSPEGKAHGTVLTGLKPKLLRRKVLNALRRIPGMGRVLDALRKPLSIPGKLWRKIRSLSFFSRARTALGNLVHINRLTMRVQALEGESEIRALREEIASLKSRLQLKELLEETSAPRTNVAYKRFEDEMRGSREEILERLTVYDGVVGKVRETNGENLFALDLGCGRGEWLELMRTRYGVKALGVDSDPSMLRDCGERGLLTVRADLMTYLRNAQSGSADIVTLFHVAEHLPFNVLTDALTECRRVLREGGALIVETPNPENMIVGACNFYTDPTHITKLPPALLRAMTEGAGFDAPEILRLHPYPAIADGAGDSAAVRELSGFFNHPADYAVIAYQKRDGGGRA